MAKPNLSMKHSLIYFCCVVYLFFIAGFSSSSGHVVNESKNYLPKAEDSAYSAESQSSSKSSFLQLQPNGENLVTALSRRPSRSLLSLPSSASTTIHNTTLIAALDGTIYLVEIGSKRVIWSIPTGLPIYSSYQAAVNKDTEKDKSGSINFIECGDDWELYMQTNEFGKTKLPMHVADFISKLPVLGEDGELLGATKSTVFHVEAKTGKLNDGYTLPKPGNSSAILSDEMQTVPDVISSQKRVLVDTDSDSRNNSEVPLKIIRKDYFLESRSRTGKVLWSLAVAEFQALLQCRVEKRHSSEIIQKSEGFHNSEARVQPLMPLQCNEPIDVYRLRSNALFESSRFESLIGPSEETRMLSTLKPRLMLPFDPQHEEENWMLPSSEQNTLPPLQPKTNFHGDGNDKGLLSLPSTKINESPKGELLSVTVSLADGLSLSFQWVVVLPLVLPISFLIFLIYYQRSKGQVPLNDQKSQLDPKNTSPKRRKPRKAGRNNYEVDRTDKNRSSDNDNDKESWPHLRKLIDMGADGRRIGKLFISNNEIAKGSNGTVVFEGNYEGREVAVKRLVQVHHDVAFKEIQNLVASDRHPNIVRWHGVEYDQDFVYLSLERCTCSLDDLIQVYSESSSRLELCKDQDSRLLTNTHLEMVKDVLPDLKLWQTNGHPSPLLLKLMRDMVSGLVHLHELGIIHRDLKPQNVLIFKDKSLSAKLSDMGISRRLVGDMSSLGNHATGCGSSGWQAPEQLTQGRQTRAVDMFSLGCVLFYCMTGGKHPFGDRLERDINIVKNNFDLFLLDSIPEAYDLISRLLDPNPDLRPKALEVLHHPLFWSSEMRLSFLRDTSDRVELEDRESNSNVLKAMERVAPVALGGKWDIKMEPAFISNIGHYRRYKYDSVRDLLRVMRNKLNHYRELPKEIQELLGSVPEGFDVYFASRFPRFLIEVYKVVFNFCREEECFQKYFGSNAY